MEVKLQEMAKKMTRGLGWNINVDVKASSRDRAETSDSPNGCDVKFYTGIWDSKRGQIKKESKDELAVVLGHELAHCRYFNSLEWALLSHPRGPSSLIGLMGSGVEGFLNPGRASRRAIANEIKADYYGMLFMIRAGYSPEAAIKMWQRREVTRKGDKTFKRQSLSATHPTSAHRLEELQVSLGKAKSIKQAGKIFQTISLPKAL